MAGLGETLLGQTQNPDWTVDIGQKRSLNLWAPKIKKTPCFHRQLSVSACVVIDLFELPL